MIDRRTAIAGGAALLATGAAPPDLLARAIAARGGRRAIERVRAIGWTGRAVVTTGGQTLDLAVETRVEPFVRARSRSWLVDKGPSTARTLVVEPNDGWLERDGARHPLPGALVAHERQQYAIYGYLLLRGGTIVRDGLLRSERAGFPPATMACDGRGAVTSADYVVASAEDGRPVRERFAFSGEIAANGLRWPRRMTIDQDGRRFFELAIERLTVETA